MGIEIGTPPSHLTLSNKFTDYLLTINSMSQRFQQGNFNYSNGFNNRSEMMHQDQHHHHALTTIEGVDSGGGDSSSVYESAGGMTMLSEMFNFQAAGGAAAVAAPSDILDTHMAETYRLQRPSDWYGNRMVGSLGTLGETKQHQHQHSLSSINVDSAATAMQLFLLNPQPRSPSPTSTTPTSSTPLHLLHPDRSTPPDYHPDATFPGNPIPQTQFTWISGSGGGENTQRLSLSLSSLQHLEAVKAEEIRIGDAGLMYYNQGPSSSSSSYQMKHLGSQYPQGMGQNQNHEQQIHGGYSSSSFSVIHLLRNSKYAKAAQELLEEICSVGRGHMKNSMRFGKNIKNPNKGNNQSAGGESSSSLSKEAPPLSAADKIEYQRKKATLLSMLDEVHRRYSHYCEQMQMVVNSFDSVMGYGAATPYTVLAQKAMSRHFRCLKDAILGQLKIIREVTGEKDGGSSGITKGETPRLKLLDQSLRQQRAFQQMGIMDQEAWRPQRGLPERSVTVLRAWLFEHFLHPYPSDADKHLLARQTGLSRNQVSNWFINARVRLWKPMVEEMYQQESKEQEEDEGDMIERDKTNSNAQTPTPSPTSPTIAGTGGRRSEIDAYENDASLNAINRQCFSENQATATTNRYNDVSPMMLYNQVAVDHRPGAIVVDYGTTGADAVDIDSKLVRFGTTTGDVSLTLGLQHTGNLPENNQFSDGDFGSC